MASRVLPFSMTWFIVLCGHICKHDSSLCDLRVASPSCPPGLVCLLTSLTTLSNPYSGVPGELSLSV